MEKKKGNLPIGVVISLCFSFGVVISVWCYLAFDRPWHNCLTWLPRRNKKHIKATLPSKKKWKLINSNFWHSELILELKK